MIEDYVGQISVSKDVFVTPTTSTEITLCWTNFSFAIIFFSDDWAMKEQEQTY